MPCVETKIVINGDSKPIFEIIKNMEAYPSFMHDLVSVEILERGENTTVSHWVSKVDFEFGIPMIAGLLNPILKKKVRENSENMLTAVKAQIEK